MANKTVKKTITIDAPVSEVWNALTDPDLVKQYLFGANVESDWQEGSDIIYSGTWEGKEYQDKGKIVEIEEEKLLHHTHWSSLSGTEDEPENYYDVQYELKPKSDGRTVLTVTQKGNLTKEAAEHSGKNWEIVLEKLKNLLETELSTNK